MNVADLLADLEAYLEAGGQATDPVRLAYQPSWPLVAEVARTHAPALDAADADADADAAEAVLYVMAGPDVGYYAGDRADFSAD